MTAAFDLNAIAQMSAAGLADCLVWGTLLAIFAGLTLTLARRQNSGTRFAAWFSTLMAIAALPLIHMWWSRGASLSAASSYPAITLPGSWGLYVFAAWAVIALWSLAGVGKGLWHLHIVRNTCIPIDPALLDARLQKTLQGIGATRRVELCTSDQVQVPAAIGLIKPAIVVPRWVMQELPPDELNQVFLHELAHLRRRDDWTNLAQKIVKALFFFHPAVWWIERKLSLEREMACDDAVLVETASPRAYAECLTHLAERTLIQRSLALAQAALGRVRQTSLRVAQILDHNRPTGRPLAARASCLIAGLAIACVFCVSRAPQLVAFRDSGASTATSTLADTAGRQVSPSVMAPVVNAAFHSQAVSPLQGRERPTVNHRVANSLTGTRGSANVQRVPAVQATHPPGHAIFLTRSEVQPLVFTETLFVVVEGHEGGAAAQPAYAIQVWHVLVVRAPIDPSTRIPAKQT